MWPWSKSFFGVVPYSDALLSAYTTTLAHLHLERRMVPANEAIKNKLGMPKSCQTEVDKSASVLSVG